MMKTNVPFVLGVLMSIGSISSTSAQTSPSPSDPSAPRTRAQVIAEISIWRAAGYNPIIDLTHYPNSALEAARAISEQHPLSPRNRSDEGS
jgi:hypothetical protein